MAQLDLEVWPHENEIVTRLSVIQQSLLKEGETDIEVSLVVYSNDWQIVTGDFDTSESKLTAHATLDVEDNAQELLDIARDLMFDFEQLVSSFGDQVRNQEDVTSVRGSEDEDYYRDYYESKKVITEEEETEVEETEETTEEAIEETSATSIDKSVQTNILLTEILPTVISGKDLEGYELDGVEFTGVDDNSTIDGLELITAILAKIPKDVVAEIVVNAEQTVLKGIDLEAIKKILVEAKVRHSDVSTNDIKTEIEDTTKFYSILTILIGKYKVSINIQNFTNAGDIEEVTNEEVSNEEVENTEETTETEEETVEEIEEVTESRYVIKNLKGQSFNFRHQRFGSLSKNSYLESKDKVPYSLPGLGVRREEDGVFYFYESAYSSKPFAQVTEIKKIRR